MSLKHTPFLRLVAKDLVQRFGNDFSNVLLVLPNKRAGLYLRNYLSEEIAAPAIEPLILPIADFFKSGSELLVGDRLSLVYELFLVYKEIIFPEEEFDRFLPWGEMLLKDFDELDKYMVHAGHLFTVLADHRELIERFDYLDEDQREFIDRFWRSLEPVRSEEQRNFYQVWQGLFNLYEQFKITLKEQKQVAYEGMIYREAAENPAAFYQHFEGYIPVFAGFHVLNMCEESIFSYARDHAGALFYWDIDQAHLNDPVAEAGRFMRNYIIDYPGAIEPGNYFREPKNITVIGAANNAGQALILGDLLSGIQQGEEANTAVILPDEAMLYPVINAMPPQVKHMNITMGFPVNQSLIFQFLSDLRELQKRKKNNNGTVYWHFKALGELLKHPFIQLLEPAALSRMEKMSREEKIFYFTPGMLGIIDPAILDILSGSPDFILFLKGLTGLSGTLVYKAHDPSVFPGGAIEKEVLYQFYLQTNRFHDMLVQGNMKLSFDTAMKSLVQLIRLMKVPFSGEPVQGLQVMGLLETRNLDFKNVYIMGMNDSVMPAPPPSGSFIPYNLRKGFGLPALEHHDAFYAYYFFRILQRAENIYLLYDNSEKNASGELSRFVTQLSMDLGQSYHTKVQLPSLKTVRQKEIHLPADTLSAAYLENFLDKEGKETGVLSPTALRNWFECKLRFYFQYVLGLHEDETIREGVDAGTFGNLVHDGMFFFYKALMDKKGSNLIEKTDLEHFGEGLEAALEATLRKQFFLPEDEPVHIQGQRVLAMNVTRSYMQAILLLDKDYTPFSLLHMEDKLTKEIPLEVHKKRRVATIGGRVDRVDIKDGTIRVIDYKTGTVKANTVPGIEALFEHTGDHVYGELLQIMIYSAIVAEKNPGNPVVPNILSLKDLFRYGNAGEVYIGERTEKQVIEDWNRLSDHFNPKLAAVLSSFFNETAGYPQTKDLLRCSYCAYRRICHRD